MPSADSTAPSAMTIVEHVLAETRVLQRHVAALQDLLIQRTLPVDTGSPGPVTAVLPTHALYASCFGIFSLYRFQSRLTLGRHKAVVDLCRFLVAHAGQLVPRDVLVNLLWPDAEPTRAIHRLHVAISSLRSILDVPDAEENHIQLEDDRYSIGVDMVVTDCDRFENHYREGKACLTRGKHEAAAVAFRSITDLYTGEYLADDHYAEWTHARRAYFSERYLTALTFLCEHAVDRNNLLASLEYAGQIVEHDNLRERAHRHLMRAHYLLGQRACALRQYTLCAALLEHELGVLPSLPTQRLYQAIAGDTPLPGETPIHL